MDWYPLTPQGATPDEALLADWLATANVAVEPYWLLAHAMGYPGFPRAPELLPVMMERMVRPPTSSSRFELVLRARNALPSLIRDLRRGNLTRFQLDAPRTGNVEPTLQAFNVPPCGGLTEAPLRLMGVIDDGLPFAHPNLLRVNGDSILYPRTLCLWDQGGTQGMGWTSRGLPMGAELRFHTMRRLIGPRLGTLNERAVYRRAGYKQHLGRLPHGCGVTHFLADNDPSLPDGSRRDVAPVHHMHLLAVQLPARAVHDTAGAWLGFYALHGLRYIVRRASQLARRLGRSWHLVVNLSYGSVAGPHDGSTMFEQAMDELICDSAKAGHRLDIVLAAGNARALPVHARRTLRTSEAGIFRCAMPPDNPSESYAEFWLPDRDEQGSQVAPSVFELTLIAPNGKAHTIRAGAASLLRRPGETLACGGVVFAHRVMQGERGTMVLLMLRPTRSVRLDRAPAGIWTVEIRHTHPSPLTVRAWVERNDLVGQTRRAQQARFIRDAADASHVTGNESLSHCAHGELVTVAGAVLDRTAQVTNYSGTGWSSGGKRPDWYASGDSSKSVGGLLVPGWHAGEYHRMSGTSIAAPWVARWLAAGSPSAARRPTHGDRNGLAQVGPPNWLTVSSS